MTRPPGSGFWGRLGAWIERRHRAVWIGTTLGLLALALGTLTLDSNLTTANAFRGEVEAVEGQLLLERVPGRRKCTDHGARDRPAQLDAVLAAAGEAPEVVSVGRVETGEPGAPLHRHPHEDPFSQEGFAQIRLSGSSCARPAATPFSSAARRPRSSTCARPCARTRSSSSRSCSSSCSRSSCCSCVRSSGRSCSWGRSCSRSALHSASHFSSSSSRRLPRRGSELSALRVHLPRRAGDRLQHLPHGARARRRRCPRSRRC